MNNLAIAIPAQPPVIALLTAEDVIDNVHRRPHGTAKRNYQKNRRWFIEGEDYFLVPESQKDDFRTLGISVPNRGLTVLTESGYLTIVKSLKDDLAWTIHKEMVRSYFKASQISIPQSLPEALRLAADLAERVERVSAERDHAVATKSLIGAKREASAMATASVAVRETNRLLGELGRNARHATIIAVQNATGKEYNWTPLRRWCRVNNVEPSNVLDARFGTVKAWPADAWKEVHGVDLAKLFPLRTLDGEVLQ